MNNPTSTLATFRCPLCLFKNPLPHDGAVCEACQEHLKNVIQELSNETPKIGGNWMWVNESKKYFRYAQFVEGSLPEAAGAIRTMINQLNLMFLKTKA